MGGTIGFLEQLKGFVKFDRSTVQNMKGQEIVECIQTILSHTRDEVDQVTKNSWHDKLLTKLYNQLDELQEEIKQINEEIKREKDPDKRRTLENERGIKLKESK